MISGFPSSDILHSTALGVEVHVSSAAAGTCLPPTDATAAQQPRWRRHQALASGVCDSGALACSSICAAVSRCSARSMFRMQRSQAEPFLARTCPIMSEESDRLASQMAPPVHRPCIPAVGGYPMGREATSMQLQTASEAPAGDLSLPPRDGSLSTPPGQPAGQDQLRIRGAGRQKVTGAFG